MTPSLDPDLAAASDLAAAAESIAGEVPTTQPIQPRDEPVIGADISWPQCPPGMGIEHKETSGQPLPTEEAEYVVIGLTNGPGFHANPCLADQVAWAKGRGLLTAAYAVVSYPSDEEAFEYGDAGPYERTATGGGWLRNVGYAQARFNIAVHARRRARVADRVARRRAGAALRLERRPGGQRPGRHRRRAGLPQRRLPDRGLLDARAVGRRRGRPRRSASPSGGRPGRRRRPRR